MLNPFVRVRGTSIAARVAEILIIRIGPCEDEEEARCDPEEIGRSRTLFLASVPLVLLYILS